MHPQVNAYNYYNENMNSYFLLYVIIFYEEMFLKLHIQVTYGFSVLFLFKETS